MSSFESSCKSSSADFFKVPLEDLLEVSPGVTHDASARSCSRNSARSFSRNFPENTSGNSVPPKVFMKDPLEFLQMLPQKFP